MSAAAAGVGCPATTSRNNAMLPSADIQCPYCGEWIEILIDDSAGDQQYIEDCQVCCSPINIAVRIDEDGVAQVIASAENEA